MSVYEKTCIKCNDPKPISEFYREKKSPDGYRADCKKCKNMKKAEWYKENQKIIKQKAKKHYDNNIEAIRKNKREKAICNRKVNGDEVRAKARNRYNKNSEKVKELRKIYYEENNYKIKNRAKIHGKQYRKDNRGKINDKQNKYRKNNPHIVAWRSILKNSLKRLGTPKYDTTIKLLGYSAEQLRNHITSLFKEGMSWSNHGEWHIDHKIPVSKFSPNIPPNIVNALSNLQPIWAKENLSKGSKMAA